MRRAHHLAAERLADGLVAEADAEDRGRFACGAHELETDAGFVRRARPGRQDDSFRGLGEGLVDADLIVSPDRNVRAELAEIVDEVEREAVIVVDQRDALHSPSRPGRAVFSDAPPRPSSRAGRLQFLAGDSMTYRASPADGAAWITGASSGIGRAAALELARRGYRVHATARRKEALEALSLEAAGLKGSIVAAPGDVTDRARMAELVEEIERQGPIALALLNAGGHFSDVPGDLGGVGFTKTMALNLQGVLK